MIDRNTMVSPTRRVLTLAGCTIGAIFNIGSLFTGSLAVFMKPIAEDTGWSRSAISFGVTIAMLAAMLSLPFAGRLADRWGARWVIGAGIPAYALCWANLGLIPPTYPWFLAGCLLLGITGAATYVPIYIALIATHFKARLGLAIGVISAGAGVGLIIGPILSQSLIAAFGWQGAYFSLGAVILLVMVPVTLLMLRDAPGPRSNRAATAVRAPFSSPRFWVIAFTYALAGMTVGGTVVHLVPMLTDQGLQPSSASLIAASLGAASIGSRLGVGLLLDRLDAGLLGGAAFAVAAIGLCLLARPFDPVVAIVAVVLIGCALGGESDILSYLVRDIFGTEKFGAVVSLATSAFLGGLLGGPLIFGMMFDATSSYNLPLYFFAGCSLLAAMLHAPLTFRSKQAEKSSHSDDLC